MRVEVLRRRGETTEFDTTEPGDSVAPLLLTIPCARFQMLRAVSPCEAITGKLPGSRQQASLSV